MKKNSNVYPLIDLFAGPGGLGEGFSSLFFDNNLPVFKSVASIERDLFSHKTLTLRHFFRSFGPGDVPSLYYDYIAANITRDKLEQGYPDNWKQAERSSLKITLGIDTHNEVEFLIKQRLGKAKKWALVGGPPCQAYSLVGRYRMKGDPNFKEDERHFLYKEYLKTIIDHKPLRENRNRTHSITTNFPRTVVIKIDSTSNASFGLKPTLRKGRINRDAQKVLHTYLESKRSGRSTLASNTKRLPE